MGSSYEERARINDPSWRTRGPFGEYKVVLNRHQLTTHAFLIDPSMFKQVVLRPYTRTLLAKNGDSDRHQIVAEISCKHSSFADSHMITGLS